jgi:hypothetical protein
MDKDLKIILSRCEKDYKAYEQTYGTYKFIVIKAIDKETKKEIMISIDKKDYDSYLKQCDDKNTKVKTPKNK